MKKQRYTISGEAGKRAHVMLTGHRQNIWNRSEAVVSDRVLRRIEKRIGTGPYGNPCGDFGRAQTVVLH